VTRLGIARTFQNLRLFRNLTVIDNVIVATYCRTRAGVWDALFKTRRARAEQRESEEKAHELLALCGIDASWWNLARNLPYGDQRRLEIARALATEPTLLLLDEPTCGMNPAEKEGMMALIERLRESGRTVILVEHDMNVVMGMSDYIIVLDHGIKICEGQPGAVQCDPAVIEAYLGRGRDHGLAAD
jgi:branched-chain amino acid transport system ATP-binding protein